MLQDKFDVNTVSIDWLTVTVRHIGLADIMADLGLLNIKFQELPHGAMGYTRCLTAFGMNFLFDGIQANMGICINFTGDGCRAFETFGYGDYNILFDWVRDYEQNNCTRIDIAFDDFTGLLPLDKIRDDCIAGNYISRCKGGSIQQGFGNQNGLTVYFGSPQSDFRLRFYDKAAEQCVSDTVPHWVRCELQIRGDLTYNTLKPIQNDYELTKTFFEVLNNYLRFIEPFDNTVGNRSRDSVLADYWQAFIADYGKRTVFEHKGYGYNEDNLRNYVFGQAGGALLTYLELHDIYDFFKELYKVSKKELNPKYKALIQRYNITSGNFVNSDKDKNLA